MHDISLGPKLTLVGLAEGDPVVGADVVGARVGELVGACARIPGK